MNNQETADILVWDPFVRITHWTIAVGFFVAYFTEDEALTLYVWAAYTIGVLVALHVLWEVITNLTFALVVAHIPGVILASIVHRENLLRAMVTGRKRADGVDELPNVRP